MIISSDGPCLAQSAAASSATAPATGSASDSTTFDPMTTVSPGMTPMPFTLDQAIRTVLSTPRNTQRQKFQHDAAVRKVQLAQGDLSPQVKLGASARAADKGDIVDTSGQTPYITGDRIRVGVSGTYSIYDHGALRDRVKVEKDNLISTDAGIALDRIGLADGTTSAFYDVLRGQRAVAISDLSVKALREQLRAAQARMDLGAVTKSEVLSAQSALDAAIAEQQNSQLRLDQARASFANLLILDPQTVAPVAVEPDRPAALAMTTNQLIDVALSNDQRFKALQADDDAAHQNLAIIKANHQPGVGLVAGTGLGYRDQTTGSHATGRPYYIVALNLSLPILDTPRYKASVQNQQDEIALQDIALDQYRDTVKERVISAALSYQASVNKLVPASDSVREAEEAFRLVSEQYTVGTATQEQVLTSLARLTESRIGLTNAEADRDLAIRQIMLATGLTQPPVGPYSATPAAAMPAERPEPPSSGGGSAGGNANGGGGSNGNSGGSHRLGK